MKKLFFLAFLASLSACDAIKREAGYPGGNIGFYADERLYRAHTHEQRVDRQLILLAVLAPLAAQTAQTGEDARLSIESINSVYRGLSRLKEIVGTCSFESIYETDKRVGKRRITDATEFNGVTDYKQTKTQTLTDRQKKKYEKFTNLKSGDFSWTRGEFEVRFSGFLVESETAAEAGQKNLVLHDGQLNVALAQNSVKKGECASQEEILAGSVYEFETTELQVQKALFRLLRTSADNLGIKITRGNVTNVNLLSVANILRKARSVLPVLHNYLATFRDVTIIYAEAVANECGNTNGPNSSCGKLRKHFEQGFVHDRANVAEDELFRPINAMMKLATRAAENEAKNWRLGSRHVAALFRHVDIACDRLKSEAQLASGEDGCSPPSKKTDDQPRNTAMSLF